MWPSLAQTATDPSAWDALGPWGPAIGALVTFGGGAITWLVKDRARIVTQRDEGLERERNLYDRIITQHEKLVPLIERLARELDRRDR